MSEDKITRYIALSILGIGLVAGSYGIGFLRGYNSGQDRGRKDAIESLDMAQYDLHQFRRMDTSRTSEEDREYAEDIIAMTRARDFLKEGFGLDDIVEK